MRYIISRTSRRGNDKGYKDVEKVEMEKAEPWRTDIGDCEWLLAMKKSEIRASVEAQWLY